ncbi:DUF6233 domain-containing protein [Streptomyces sp. NPDC056628]|uniref:DUF6233 domain-containing protein n=1 Tax=Streptomyces sp. NPDC056628 TaxID=3345882 RepID=UPI00369D6285
MGADRSPVQVHAGDCHMAGQRRRAVSRDEARRLLATGLEGCGHCRPAARLRIIELEPPPPTSTVPVTHLMVCPASSKRPRGSLPRLRRHRGKSRRRCRPDGLPAR